MPQKRGEELKKKRENAKKEGRKLGTPRKIFLFFCIFSKQQHLWFYFKQRKEARLLVFA